MTELPTLYGWLLKIAIVAAIVVFVYLCVYIDKRRPDFKNTILFKYVVTPVLYIVGFVVVMLFILL